MYPSVGGGGVDNGRCCMGVGAGGTRELCILILL